MGLASFVLALCGCYMLVLVLVWFVWVCLAYAGLVILAGSC